MAGVRFVTEIFEGLWFTSVTFFIVEDPSSFDTFLNVEDPGGLVVFCTACFFASLLFAFRVYLYFLAPLQKGSPFMQKDAQTTS